MVVFDNLSKYLTTIAYKKRRIGSIGYFSEPGNMEDSTSLSKNLDP